MSLDVGVFGAAQARAFDQTEAHLETLSAQYDRVVRAAGVRAATAFSEQALTAAAGDPPWKVPPLDDLIDVTRVTQELLGATKATREQAAINATRPILSAMGVSFSLEAPMVKDLVGRTGARAAALSIPGLQDAVRAAITQAFEEGLSVPQTAALIAQKANGLAAYQSEMLARTDLIGTANGGSLLAAKAVWPEQGTLLKRWTNATNSRTENDGHIRPTHLEANGQRVDIDDPFLVGDDALLFPGDPAGSDAEVCNCRCSLIYEEPTTVAALWDESKHPREGRGRREGGRFRGDYDTIRDSPIPHLSDDDKSVIRRAWGMSGKSLEDPALYALNRAVTLDELSPETRSLLDSVLRDNADDEGDGAIDRIRRKLAPALLSAAWDEAKHPRFGRGVREGGRFRGGTVTRAVESRHHAGGGKRVGDLYVGDRFYLVYPEGPKLFEVVETPSSSHSIVREVDNPAAGYTHLETGVMTEEPYTAPMVVPPAPPEGAIEVTGRTLKNGSTFWGQKRGEWVKFEVVESVGGTGRYLRIKDVATGQQAVMKASSKVTVNPEDFPAAAKRAAKVATNSVEGEYGKAFSQSPGAGTKVTQAATVASKEASSVLTIPDGTLRPVPLKETRSMKFGGSFQAGRKRGEEEYHPVSVTLRAGDETPMGMRDNLHHEMGHFIDYDGLETEAGKTASETRDPMVAGPVMDAIDNSRSWERITSMRAGTRGAGSAADYSIVTNPGTPIERRFPTDRQHLSYLAEPTEKFARAYEQYIATKVGGGDATRLSRYRGGASAPLDVKEYRGDGEGASYRSFYGWYWDDEDFKPIESAFDEMFGRVGWLKN